MDETKITDYQELNNRIRARNSSYVERYKLPVDKNGMMTMESIKVLHAKGAFLNVVGDKWTPDAAKMVKVKCNDCKGEFEVKETERWKVRCTSCYIKSHR